MRYLAITGMAAALGNLADISSLERALYLGEACTAALAQRDALENLGEQALADAGLAPGPALALVLGVSAGGDALSGAIEERWQVPLERRRRVTEGRTAQLLESASQLLPDAEAVLVVAAGPRGGVALVLTSPERATGRAYAEVTYADVPPADRDRGELTTFDPLPDPVMSGGVSTISGNPGDLGTAQGLASLIPAVLAVHHRYVPSAAWRAPKEPGFTPPQPYPWFTPAGRARMVWVPGGDGQAGGCLVVEPRSSRLRPRPIYEPIRPVRLLRVSGDDPEQILLSLERLERRLIEGQDMTALGAGRFTVAVLGRTRDELLRESASAKRGVPAAFERGSEWQTPRGSFFTSQPVGQSGTVAFVYPGAFSAYPGMARDAFRAFPHTHAVLASRTTDPGASFAESLVFPRVVHQPTASELADYESRLHSNPVAMIECGTACSVVYTHVLHDVLGITPAASLGYSLGEMSMLWALGAWTEGDEGRRRFRTSPLFRTRLAGAKQAVREYRRAAGYTDDPDEVWATYTLLASAEDVERVLPRFDLAFLTVINGPREVLIGGDPAQCEAVAEAVGCERIRMRFDYPLHCPVTLSEAESLARVNAYQLWPVGDIRVYSAADYRPVTMEADTVAETVARSVCHTFDFPRLVEQVYKDGARIFLEVGPSGACTRLIDGILAGRPHLAVSMDRRGVDAELSLSRLLARLTSHGVGFNALPGDAQRTGPQPAYRQ